MVSIPITVEMQPELPKPRIAISGKMRSGKDTLASLLSETLEIPRGSFAAPLKEGVAIMGLPLEKGDPVSRAVLQGVGHLVRQLDPAHWVKQLDIRTPYRDETGLVITDLRYANEWAWAKAWEFLLVRLVCSREAQISRGAEPERLDHPSEIDLDFLPPRAWDLVLDTEALTPEEALQAVLGACRLRGWSG